MVVGLCLVVVIEVLVGRLFSLEVLAAAEVVVLAASEEVVVGDSVVLVAVVAAVEAPAVAGKLVDYVDWASVAGRLC